MYYIVREHPRSAGGGVRDWELDLGAKPDLRSCHHVSSEVCIMIGAREAVVIAKEQAAGMLGQGSTSLEEIERDSYKGRDMWIVTLGFPRDLSQVPPLARISMEPLQYKRFLVDAETGELVAIKLRELASR